MSRTRKAFFNLSDLEVLTIVKDHVSLAVPELSMSIKDILSQFAYIDGVRLKDIANQGYPSENVTDEQLFNIPEWESLDMSEREELYDKASEIVNRFQMEQAKAQRAKHLNTENEPQVSEGDIA